MYVGRHKRSSEFTLERRRHVLRRKFEADEDFATFGRRLEANVWTMLAVKPPAHLAHRSREHRTADTQFYKPHPVLQKVLQKTLYLNTATIKDLKA